MKNNKLDSLNFDRGIEQIFVENAPEDLHLPDSATVIPSDEHLRVHLEETIVSPSLEETVFRELTPEIKDRSILLPTRFSALLQEVHRELLEKVTKKANRDFQCMKEAALLLEEEQKLMELLNDYRSVLFKG